MTDVRYRHKRWSENYNSSKERVPELAHYHSKNVLKDKKTIVLLKHMTQVSMS